MRFFSLAALACLMLGQSQDDQAAKSKASPQQPQFFDDPQFVVSGVTDYTYRGGHGSDSVLRSSEALTKATASLDKDANVETMPLSEVVAWKQSLEDKIAHEPSKADLHRELADVEERLGKSLGAVREYQLATELDATERNLFDWGADLLKHRAGQPAIEVFTRGSKFHPDSVRMQLGLGAAFYLVGEYAEAAQHFFAAIDMHPNDAAPYMFLSKVEAREITASPAYLDRLARFAATQRDNEWANYLYAECLWRRRTPSDDQTTVARVKGLAERAVNIDPQLGVAYLLLGIVASEQRDLPDAIAALRKASEVTPDLAEAHYRLAQVYEQTGENGKIQQERETYKLLSAKSAQDTEAERKQVQQFVYQLRDGKAPSEK